MNGDDVAQQLEHEADQLEHHLDELQDHIDAATKAAAPIREHADPTSADRGSGTTTDAAPEPLASIDPRTTEPNETADPAPSDADDDAGDGEGDSDEAVGGPTPGHASGGDD